ncbi:hypothetical protein DPX16_10167 [Anabarilius grahami]|uniref:Uncharacterized protein n=1 Tax=Anabarilius grahami TaxID=495550 RepID=A0A3N0XX62_ANAGA|nr:hypothetical protein DPX16_10167 [Anabarilius grahami]
MSMSTMSTIFSENAEQSSSTEFSDELTTALAAGRWWAIMEVSHPISEEPEYGDLISGQWGETVEAGEASCPTSLVFSDASQKSQRRFQHSGFSDATLKTTKQWRQKTTQGAPVPSRSKQGAPVSASSEKGDLTSSLVFSDSSEKAPNSDLSDATLKTMEQQRKQRKKKHQGLL